MPWKLFWLLYSKLSSLTALDRLNGAQAVALGSAMTFSDKKSKSKIRAQLRREAAAAGLDTDDED